MGHVHIVRDVYSPPESVARTIRVYTPTLYDRHPDERFPVLYLHDGQNVFDHPASAVDPAWGVDSALEDLVAHGLLGPWLLVAIDHRGVDRLGDYSPWPDARLGGHARAASYARFLTEHLKPWIDRAYRTWPEREGTAVMGSSMGGLVSLYLAGYHADTFGRVGALSPSVMAAHGELFHAFPPRRPGAPRIYLDAGVHEGFDANGVHWDYGGGARAFHHRLRDLGYGPEGLRLVLEPGGQHREADWRRRLPEAMRWLLG